MDLGISGKRALVLGASRGLGGASARALLGEGVEVHAVSRSGKVLDPAMHAIQADLSSPAGVDALIEGLKSIGPIDILVANTGGPRPSAARDVPPADWLENFQAMAVSIFRVADATLPAMIAAGWGRIITIGSSGIEQPISGLAISNSVRGAVAGWSKTLAAEVAQNGVTVNMVLPGRIETDRIRELDGLRSKATGIDESDIRAESIMQIPAKRYGLPDEFGAVVVFLASAPAGYITGSMLRVDGGLTRAL